MTLIFLEGDSFSPPLLSRLFLFFSSIVSFGFVEGTLTKNSCPLGKSTGGLEVVFIAQVLNIIAAQQEEAQILSGKLVLWQRSNQRIF